MYFMHCEHRYEWKQFTNVAEGVSLYTTNYDTLLFAGVMPAINAILQQQRCSRMLY